MRIWSPQIHRRYADFAISGPNSWSVSSELPSFSVSLFPLLPSTTKCCTAFLWCVGVFHVVRVEHYRPCRLRIAVNMLACWVSFPAIGGFASCPTRSQALRYVAVAVPSFLLCTHMCLSRRARQFAAMSGGAHPPFFLGFSSDGRGTLKVAPCQMYHAIAVVNCRVYVAVAGKIYAVYQIVAKRSVHIEPFTPDLGSIHTRALLVPCILRPTFLHFPVYRAAEGDSEDLYGRAKLYT